MCVCGRVYKYHVRYRVHAFLEQDEGIDSLAASSFSPRATLRDWEILGTRLRLADSQGYHELWGRRVQRGNALVHTKHEHAHYNNHFILSELWTRAWDESFLTSSWIPNRSFLFLAAYPTAKLAALALAAAMVNTNEPRPLAVCTRARCYHGYRTSHFPVNKSANWISDWADRAKDVNLILQRR